VFCGHVATTININNISNLARYIIAFLMCLVVEIGGNVGRDGVRWTFGEWLGTRVPREKSY